MRGNVVDAISALSTIAAFMTVAFQNADSNNPPICVGQSINARKSVIKGDGITDKLDVCNFASPQVASGFDNFVFAASSNSRKTYRCAANAALALIPHCPQ